MSSRKVRQFECTQVNEVVQIFLQKKQGWAIGSELTVKCNQTECQYVDKNEPPCPLSLDMFADEIREQAEQRAQQRLKQE